MKKIKMTSIKDRQWKFDILLMGPYEEANQNKESQQIPKTVRKLSWINECRHWGYIDSDLIKGEASIHSIPPDEKIQHHSHCQMSIT